MSTLQAPDWVVPGSDRAGFRMFPRDPSVCKAWNAVRVPPRAQFPLSGALFGPLTRVDSVHALSAGSL
jgi:hypothetical protein